VSSKLLVLSGEFREGNSTNIRSDDEVLGRDHSWCGDSSDSDLEDDLPLERFDSPVKAPRTFTSQRQAFIPKSTAAGPLARVESEDTIESEDTVQPSQTYVTTEM
jgi:hypothetical protein